MLTFFEWVLQRTRTPQDEHFPGTPLLWIFWQTLLASSLLQLIERVHDLLLTHPNPQSIFVWTSAVLFPEKIRILLLVTLFGLSWLARGHRCLPLLSFCLAAYELSVQIPGGANHNYLNSFCLMLASLGLVVSSSVSLALRAETAAVSADPSAKLSLGGETPAWQAIWAIRWLIVYSMLWSGLNKWLYGTYFQGEFFAGMVQVDPRFASFFRWLATPEEIAQFQSEGPFRFRSIIPVLGANAIYVTEIAAGLLLLIPRVANYGAALTLGILIGIELAAHELVFGLLMLNLLGLYTPRFFVRWGSRGMLVAYALLGLYLLLRTSRVISDWGLT